MILWDEIDDDRRRMLLWSSSTSYVLATFAVGLPTWIRDTIDLAILYGTASLDIEVEHRRAYLFVDCAVRYALAHHLRQAGVAKEARRLRSLAPITNALTAQQAMLSPRTMDRFEWVITQKTLYGSSRVVDRMRNAQLCLANVQYEQKNMWPLAASQAARLFEGDERDLLRRMALDALDEAIAIT